MTKYNLLHYVKNNNIHFKEKNRTKIGEIFKFGGIWWQKVRHDDYPSDEYECME